MERMERNVVRAHLDAVMHRLRTRSDLVVKPALERSPLPPAEAAQRACEQLEEISHAVVMLSQLETRGAGSAGAGEAAAATRGPEGHRNLLQVTYDTAFGALDPKLPQHDRLLAGWMLLARAHQWPIPGSPFDDSSRATALLAAAQALWEALQQRLAGSPDVADARPSEAACRHSDGADDSDIGPDTTLPFEADQPF